MISKEVNHLLSTHRKPNDTKDLAHPEVLCQYCMLSATVVVSTFSSIFELFHNLHIIFVGDKWEVWTAIWRRLIMHVRKVEPMHDCGS